MIYLKEQVEKECFLGAPLDPEWDSHVLSPPLGPRLTQVSVLQYGSITTIDVPWNVAYEKVHLLSLVDLMQQEGGPSQIGNLVL